MNKEAIARTFGQNELLYVKRALWRSARQRHATHLFPLLRVLPFVSGAETGATGAATDSVAATGAGDGTATTTRAGV